LTRIAIVGAVGSGKTSLARAVAARLHAPHVELDALRFGPEWHERPPKDRARQASTLLAMPQWVVDGNDEALRDAVWLSADFLVWFDYPLRTSLARLLRRTLARLWSSPRLPGGASEQWHRTLGPHSVVWWAIRSHRRRRAELQALLRQPRYGHLRVIRLREPAEPDEVLARVMDAVAAHDR
jgi:adenylate kinase family enzyme